MSPEIMPMVVKLLAFAIAMLPLLIDNLRTSQATNLNNLILGAAGLVMIGVEHGLGWSSQSLSSIGTWFLLGVIGLIVVAASSAMPGGIAKTMMALLLWFQPSAFFLVVTAGFILAGLMAAANRNRDVLFVPPLFVAGMSVLSANNLAIGFAMGVAVLLGAWLAARRPRMKDRMARVRTRVGE